MKKNKKQKLLNSAFSIFAFIFFCFIVFPANAQKSGDDIEASLNSLKNETLSYFTDVKGEIISVEGNAVKINAGSGKSVKAGMRLSAFKEGMNFVHPVTKEPLGRIEMPVGAVEVTSTSPDDSAGIIISGKNEDFPGAKVKIAGTKVKVLFFQGNVDWFLGDAYYQLLKESGRFELIDTGIEEADIKKVISEAKTKGAEAVLALSAEEAGEFLSLSQRLYWVSDSKRFSEKKAQIAAAGLKELRFKAGLFGPKEGDVLLSFHLPFGANFLSVGDLDGDGEPDIILVSGNSIRVYKPGVDLKLLWEFEVPSAGEVLWIDCIDANKNRKDEIILTTMRDNEVTSFIYELEGTNFIQTFKMKDLFLRRLGSEIVAQKYNKSDGFEAGIFSMIYSGGSYKKGGGIKTPAGLNIYDFQHINSPDGRQGFLAWDEKGYLNLYDEKGVRLWISKEDFGGFSRAFKKESPTVMVDRGKWSVKDRLVARGFDVLVPKRKPLLGVAIGLGYSSSKIKSIWWSGIGVEEHAYIEEIGGEILDFYPVGDRMIVLTKVPFMLKAKNILKGESPFGVMLYIFSTKGR